MRKLTYEKFGSSGDNFLASDPSLYVMTPDPKILALDLLVLVPEDS